MPAAWEASPIPLGGTGGGREVESKGERDGFLVNDCMCKGILRINTLLFLVSCFMLIQERS